MGFVWQGYGPADLPTSGRRIPAIHSYLQYLLRPGGFQPRTRQACPRAAGQQRSGYEDLAVRSDRQGNRRESHFRGATAPRNRTVAPYSRGIWRLDRGRYRVSRLLESALRNQNRRRFEDLSADVAGGDAAAG